MSFIARSRKPAYILAIGLLLAIVLTFPIQAQDDPNRGDLNLNGIPFELADAQLYASYFEYGLAVFTINIEAQIAASDVNMDGIVLTVADYIYLLRIIQGEADPESPPLDTLNGLLIDNIGDSGLMISTWFEDDVAALVLEYDIPSFVPVEVTALTAAEGMELQYEYNDPILHISLVGGLTGALPASYVPVLQVTFAGNIAVLNSAMATGYLGQPVHMSYGDDVLLGDLNLNEVPYEIADAVLFSNYLVYGESVLTINPPVQILASDVNQDGIVLTIEDFEYLLKVIQGEIVPGDPVGAPEDGNLASIKSEGIITVAADLDSPASALWLVYYSPDPGTLSVAPLEIISGMMTGFEIIDDTLRILVYDMDGISTIDDGLNDLLNIFYDGTRPEFIRAEAAGEEAQRIELNSIICNTIMCDPNQDGNLDLLDVLYFIDFLYLWVDPPEFTRNIDCNCDCQPNLLDILALIDYLYGTHAPLCTCQESMFNCPVWYSF
ncbi:MAG: hypothetical protein JW763_09190 [candidate division Zixibacteria bacterium]|nr:hypothetical protein [candidate division Zixibacteria bacterium]